MGMRCDGALGPTAGPCRSQTLDAAPRKRLLVPGAQSAGRSVGLQERIGALADLNRVLEQERVPRAPEHLPGGVWNPPHNDAIVLRPNRQVEIPPNPQRGRLDLGRL